jgi:hypothetical protein
MISLYAYMPAACLYLFIYISIWYIFLYNLRTSLIFSLPWKETQKLIRKAKFFKLLYKETRVLAHSMPLEEARSYAGIPLIDG